MQKEIGGYIELELKEGRHYHQQSIRLNLARNCLRYVIRAYHIRKLFTPCYTCQEIWTAIEAENCEIAFYPLDDMLLPAQVFDENDFILYTNYFGVCSRNIQILATQYKNLIVDNAQGFYLKPYGLASIYSPRKFFGLPDGGYLLCDRFLDEDFETSTSFQRFSHLIKRVDGGSNFGYRDFQDNEEELNRENIKRMSRLTDKMLQNIDYEYIKEIRLTNFRYLHSHLKNTNEYDVEITGEDVPMYYPFLYKDEFLRNRLIDNHIYIACCWKNVQSYIQLPPRERYLQKFLFPLLIDQRYDLSDMNRMLETINI